jgi:hypothetical protein
MKINTLANHDVIANFNTATRTDHGITADIRVIADDEKPMAVIFQRAAAMQPQVTIEAGGIADDDTLLRKAVEIRNITNGYVIASLEAFWKFNPNGTPQAETSSALRAAQAQKKTTQQFQPSFRA